MEEKLFKEFYQKKYGSKVVKRLNTEHNSSQKYGLTCFTAGLHKGLEMNPKATNESLQNKIKEDIKFECVDASNILAIVENYMKNEEYKKAQMYAEKLLCKLTAINTAQDILRRWDQ